MARIAPMNSTNVRVKSAHAPALIALGLWTALVAVLQWSGALDRLRDDLPLLTLFACFVAALACGVDAELRCAVHAQSTPGLLVRSATLIVAMSLNHALWIAFAPAVVVLGAACIARAFEARFRSTAAVSPGAKPGAP